MTNSIPADTNAVAVMAANFYTVLASGGFSAILAAAVVFLFRNWIGERIKGAIQYEYDEKLKGIEFAYGEKLESHKAQLKASNDSELEKLKAQLQAAASERSIKLTNIFEKQAEAILTIYKQLYAVQESLKSFSYSRNSEETERRKAHDELLEKYQELTAYFNTNKVLIHFETTEKFNKFHQLVANLYIGNLMLSTKDNGPRTDEEIAERLERRKELSQAEKEIPVVMKSLEEDFKRVLGIQITDVVGSKAETKTP
jgi:hypothetical protein